MRRVQQQPHGGEGSSLQEAAGAQELVSLPPSVLQLPALASWGITLGASWPLLLVGLLQLSPTYSSGGQIKSRFVISAPAAGSATGKVCRSNPNKMHVEFPANGITADVIRGSAGGASYHGMENMLSSS